MDPVSAFLLDKLYIIWGRLSYLAGVPVQQFGEWAWRNTSYYLLSPEISLLIGLGIICLIEIFSSKRDNFLIVCWIAILSLLGNLMMTIHMMYYTSRYFGYGLGTWWGGLETIDPYALMFKQLMDWGDIMIILALIGYKPLRKYRVEFIILMLAGTIAYDLMVGSSDLLAVYVMTEFGGITGYIMAAFHKKNLRSLEAGLKYFITGAAASSALLFAMSILYGATNETNLYYIQKYLASNPSAAYMPMVVFSIVLLLVAIGYKLGIAPFHLWVADVYEGSPTPVTAFISVFPKTAGYAVLMRLLFISFIGLKQIWIPILAVMSIASMVIGNVMALRQTSFKRMMAYSGISHMGYIMIGVIAAAHASSEMEQTEGFYAALYYVLVYFFMNLGIFIAAMAVESAGGTDHMDSYNGLVRRNPLLTVIFSILIIALVGLPPTVGFWAKFFVFKSMVTYAVVNRLLMALLIFALLTTAMSAYYYMRLLYRMWVLPPALEQNRRFEPILFTRLAILVPALFILLLGVMFVNVPFDYVKEAYFLVYWQKDYQI
ncbi:MAG: NADH-quinone oxidoreductase subunit N [bacterium]